MYKHRQLYHDVSTCMYVYMQHPYVQVLHAGCAITPVVLQNTVAKYSAVMCGDSPITPYC